MFKVKMPTIYSYTSSSSSSLPLDAKLKTASFLKKSQTNFSLNNIYSNAAISNSSCDTCAKSKDSFGDDVVEKTQNIDNSVTKNAQDNKSETVMMNAGNSNGIFDKNKPNVTKQYTYFFRDHKVTYNDYVSATYAALNNDYYVLDYIDNAYNK